MKQLVSLFAVTLLLFGGGFALATDAHGDLSCNYDHCDYGDECNHSESIVFGGYGYTYTCSLCGKTFTDAVAYSNHITSHTQESIKKANDTTTALFIFGAIGLLALGIGIYVLHQKKQKEEDKDISDLRNKYMK